MMVPSGDFLVASLMPLFPLKPHVYINSPTLFEGNSQPSELVKSQPLPFKMSLHLSGANLPPNC